MQRRKLVRYLGASVLSASGLGLTSQLQSAFAQTGGSVSIQWLGHTCFLFTGGGRRILVNPFLKIGCTANYRPPTVPADLVFLSSRLLDEGYVEGLPGNPRILFEPGVYQLNNTQVQGISTDHDRFGGRRFGINVAWRWNQGGLNILHLGGVGGAITVEQKILMGRPDVLLIPVGGGPKALNGEEAKTAITTLNPKLVIPTHFRTKAADDKNCDITSVDEFLKLVPKDSVKPLANKFTLKSTDLPSSGFVVRVPSYSF